MNFATKATATVLIVDDNSANLGVLSDALDQAGYEVWAAKSGKIALERVKYALPNLILLDVMMPGIDGFETCRQLQADPQTRQIPIIFMTALSDTVHKVEGLRLGAVDYITKPFQQEEVLARVKLHLRLYELSQSLEEKNALLEDKVGELATAYDSLTRMQIQMVQSEKMSGLGQMTAGIAHEINNPINFIYGNFVHAREYIQDLLALLHLYQEDTVPTPRILQKLEEIDLAFMEGDLMKLLNSINTGARRIQEIVNSMRIFTRSDEAEIKTVDIHQGLESTLTILNHRLKARPDYPAIEVVREYGALPPVECYAGQLNQVFMNILSNAIDALEEHNQKRPGQEVFRQPGKIHIATRVIEGGSVAIHIRDNGLGICEDIMTKLFNPFFTTKAIGKGTGLGLSISYQVVVEKHGGRLYCKTGEQQGAEFVVEIPIRQSVYQAA